MGIRGGDKEGVANQGGNGGGSRVAQRLAKFRRQLIQVRDGTHVHVHVCTVYMYIIDIKCFVRLYFCGVVTCLSCPVVCVAVVSDEGAVQTHALPAHSPAPHHHVHSRIWVSH